MAVQHFMSQVVILAVGFGVGYSILVVANKQKDNLKLVGKSIGWILILMSLFLALLSCYFSIKFYSIMDHPGFIRHNKSSHGCHMNVDRPIVDGPSPHSETKSRKNINMEERIKNVPQRAETEDDGRIELDHDKNGDVDDIKDKD